MCRAWSRPSVFPRTSCRSKREGVRERKTPFLSVATTCQSQGSRQGRDRLKAGFVCRAYTSTRYKSLEAFANAKSRLTKRARAHQWRSQSERTALFFNARVSPSSGKIYLLIWKIYLLIWKYAFLDRSGYKEFVNFSRETEPLLQNLYFVR